MSEKRTVILVGELQRRTAMSYVAEAPLGFRVEIKEPKRTDGQNERFHAICGDIAKSDIAWAASGAPLCSGRFCLSAATPKRRAKSSTWFQALRESS